MKKFYVNVPGWAHCMICYGVDKKHAIIRFNAQHGFKRMPAGYGIWEAA